MSQQARKNLAPEGDDSKKANDSKRKMTQAIIDEEESAKKNQKDAYEFLEDDDDFEEFDIAQDNRDDDVAMVIDTTGDGTDKKMWQEDWDDEEVDEDFAKQLRAQIRK